MRNPVKAIAIGAVAAASLAAASAAAPPQGSTQNPWSHCCGMKPWPQAGGMHGGAMHGGEMHGGEMHGGTMMGPGAAGMTRNRAAMMGGVPAPYTDVSNPLPKTQATVERGAKVYADNCASCHGETGHGDGPAGRGLTPPPYNLALLSRMPMSNWDPFMYWTVAEGGAPVGSAMPAFKASLSKEDTWAVIAYIQARLPPK